LPNKFIKPYYTLHRLIGSARAQIEENKFSNEKTIDKVPDKIANAQINLEDKGLLK
jgi:hypothetical protein